MPPRVSEAAGRGVVRRILCCMLGGPPPRGAAHARCEIICMLFSFSKTRSYLCIPPLAPPASSRPQQALDTSPTSPADPPRPPQSAIAYSLPLKKAESGLEKLYLWGRVLTKNGKDYVVAEGYNRAYLYKARARQLRESK